MVRKRTVAGYSLPHSQPLILRCEPKASLEGRNPAGAAPDRRCVLRGSSLRSSHLSMRRVGRSLTTARSTFSPGAEIGLQLPGGAAVQRALAGPPEAVRGDLGEAPARRGAAVGGAFLHDVAAAGAADLARVELLQRVAPQDVPGVEAGRHRRRR